MGEGSLSVRQSQHDQYPPFKKFRKMVILTGINLSGFMILSFLKIIKPFKFVKLYLFKCNRIGHLACNNDLFLRRLKLGMIKKNGVFYLGVTNEKVANNQLMKMLKRRMPVIQLPYNKHLHNRVSAIFDKDFTYNDQYKSLFDQIFPFYSISNSEFYMSPPSFYTNEYYEFNNSKPNLYFTKSEEKKGKKLLNKIGIDDNSWFVCFHSRDSTYLDKEHSNRSREEWKYHDYRDSEIESYLETAKYIADCGGYAIRMGFYVAKKLPNQKTPRIIDYATHHRTDLGDIYLSAKCKFFLGDTAGLWLVQTIFHVPVAGTNFIPFHTPLRKGDLFIPKKLWSVENRRFLTFKEQLDFEHKEKNIFNRICERYEEADLKPVQNTPKEILDLAKEMNERLDGTWESTEEDEKLQKKFHSLLKPHYHCYGTPACIGAKFLRDNKQLLE